MIRSRLLPPILAFLLFILVWRVSIAIFTFSPLILPPPEAVANALAQNGPYLLRHAGITLMEAALGFLAGGIIAFSLAILFFFSTAMSRAVYPYAIALKAIPLVALAPIIIVWFGTGPPSKIVLAAIISFFPILVNTLDGLFSVDKDAIDLMESISARRPQVLTKLRFPAALPYIFAGMKISASFAVVGAVVAEFVSAQSGIGYVVKSTSYYLDTDITFAAIVVAALAGLAFFGLIALVERFVIFWAPAERSM